MNNCPLRNTKRCKEYLARLNATCNGIVIYVGEGHSTSITSCKILHDAYKTVEQIDNKVK